MRLREEQIRRLAEKVCSDLMAEALIVPKQGRNAVVEGIAGAIIQDIRREQALEKDAERMLDDTIAAMGRGAADIDRRRMLRMIKEKLAKDRKIVL
ncbi:DUF507 family protein [Pelobacter propionicus]|jgi:hypothetical protein|uniref:DUF507 family protein n=1 Tax=Pelobacter propionicus (strain DSM 2379 / NBRC 103807 / OttBd1) TaxID=338966 RepID=A1ANK9_PELPD|nr:DUF507 family protein [Pelobacter propionicus]ABK98929.1 conserved hypothetical protein [Pelobacter propionicus DSM 2379]